MTVYNGVISNFIQGVSQQNRKQRFEGQVGEQVNCLSCTLDGLKKRPGSHLLTGSSILTTGLYQNAAGYTYERGDGTERYLIFVIDGAVYVRDLLTGASVAVSNNYNAYLLTANEKTDIKFCTVGDTTFIANKAKKVLGSTNSAGKANEYLIYMKKASYGTTYYIQCDGGIIGASGTPAYTGSLASYTTVSTVTLSIDTDSQEASKTAGVSTHLVMADLVSQLYTNLLDTGLGFGITAEYYGDIVRIVCPSGLNLNIKAADTNHGNDIKCIHNEIDAYENLPNDAFNGYKVKVTGTDKTEFNDYYLQYVTESGSNYGVGAWKETLAWQQTMYLDATTMPLKLVRNSSGTFDLSVCSWDARGAGDDDTNPLPSFVNNYISDILTYQNRLVLLSKDNICASVTGEFYNFFANTVVAQSDSDPIDSSSSDNQAANLEHGIIFNGNLVLFSNNAQFMHDGNTPFTTKNLNLAAKAKFSNVISVEPATAGSSIFFVSSQGGAVNLREMTMESLTQNVQANKVTEQASTYITGTPVQMTADPTNNCLFVLTSDNTSLFVYQWYKVGNEVKQQAVHRWEFLDPILFISSINGRLYMTQSHNSQVYITYIDLSDEVTTNMSFNLKLDNMWEVTASTEVTGYLKFLIPQYYQTSFAAADLTVIGTNDFTQAGKEIYCYAVMGASYILTAIPDGATGTPRAKLGLLYESEVLLTTPTLKDQYNRIQDDSALRLNYMNFDLRETGALGIKTEYYAYEALQSQFNIEDVMLTSSIISHASTVLNSAAMLIDYKYKLPIRGKADSTLIRLYSESHLPFKLVQASWTGQYNARGRRTQ